LYRPPSQQPGSPDPPPLAPQTQCRQAIVRRRRRRRELHHRSLAPRARHSWRHLRRRRLDSWQPVPTRHSRGGSSFTATFFPWPRPCSREQINTQPPTCVGPSELSYKLRIGRTATHTATARAERVVSVSRVPYSGRVYSISLIRIHLPCPLCVEPSPRETPRIQTDDFAPSFS
jgi:hypothetical protein